MPLKVQKNIPIPEPTKNTLRMGTAAAKSEEWSGLPKGGDAGHGSSVG